MSSSKWCLWFNQVCSWIVYMLCMCEKRQWGGTLCTCAAYTPVGEVAETWCSRNLMILMVCAESECVFCHHQLLWARKLDPQPFTEWTNRPIKMKTWLPMRRSQSSRPQNRAVGTLQTEHKIFYTWITNSKPLRGEQACGWNGLLKLACVLFKNAKGRKPSLGLIINHSLPLIIKDH